MCDNTGPLDCLRKDTCALREQPKPAAPSFRGAQFAAPLHDFLWSSDSSTGDVMRQYALVRTIPSSFVHEGEHDEGPPPSFVYHPYEQTMPDDAHEWLRQHVYVPTTDLSEDAQFAFQQEFGKLLKNTYGDGAKFRCVDKAAAAAAAAPVNRRRVVKAPKVAGIKKMKRRGSKAAKRFDGKQTRRRKIHTGPRGGRYYITKGRKEYV